MDKKNKEFIVYQAKNGAIELRGDYDKETVWANLNQIASIFGRDKSVISRHINNIFRCEELIRDQTVAFFATVQKEGNKQVSRNIEFFNLDMIISVGYRVNSKVATKFRQRSTQILKKHITDGWTINPSRIQKNYQLFLQAVNDIKVLGHDGSLASDEILDLIKLFSQTWFSLDAFDKGTVTLSHLNQDVVEIEADKLYEDILILKQELIIRNETTELFAQEKTKGGLQGIVGNVFQSVFGDDAYPSIESKASHLFYFIVKDHPFVDGNKRSGAFAFIRFLQKVGFSFRAKISPESLTVLALLIATSDPKDKDKIVGLVMLLLSGA